MPNKLALGTVQFGLAYGVANVAGQISPDDVGRILAIARANGIDTLDTAVAYGTSELVLGRTGADAFKVVTKLPSLPRGADPLLWIHEQTSQSISRLGVASLYGVLLHDPDQLLSEVGTGIYQGLNALKALGLTSKIGISIYEPSQLDRLKDFDIDLVQAPLSILDQRLILSGWASRLRARGTELHTRSAFLQGLLLMPPDSRPQQFAVWGDTWCEWDNWLMQTGLTALEACVRFALSVAEVDRVVVGVDRPEHLQSIIAAASGTLPQPPPTFLSVSPGLLNPSTWTNGE